VQLEFFENFLKTNVPSKRTISIYGIPLLVSEKNGQSQDYFGDKTDINYHLVSRIFLPKYITPFRNKNLFKSLRYIFINNIYNMNVLRFLFFSLKNFLLFVRFISFQTVSMNIILFIKIPCISSSAFSIIHHFLQFHPDELFMQLSRNFAFFTRFDLVL